MQKIRIYWITQLTGWFIYFTVNFFFFSFKNYSSARDVVFHLLLVPSAIILTHGFRYFIIAKKWLQKTIFIQIGIVAAASFILSLVFFAIQFVLNTMLFGLPTKLSVVDFWQAILNFSFVFFVWSVFYFSFHYIRN